MFADKLFVKMSDRERKNRPLGAELFALKREDKVEIFPVYASSPWDLWDVGGGGFDVGLCVLFLLFFFFFVCCC